LDLESWADPYLSESLLRLCSAGESQTLEFKRELPAQKRDLAKEVAAFASTEGGMILLGVADDGTVVGVQGAQAASVRDDLVGRVVGICQQVDPPVRPRLLWASSGEFAVLCVQVDKGEEPLYYVDGRPLIRHANVSRTARPEEVKALLSPQPPKKPEINPLLSDLALQLATILRWCDIDADMRCLKPWVDEWTYVAEYSAGRLREIATSDWAIDNQHGDSLETLAEKLDDVAGFLHTFGSGGDFEEVCAAVRTCADDMLNRLVSPVGVDEDSQAQVRDKVVEFSRQVSSKWGRAEKDVFDGRVEKAQEETSRIGAQIATWTYLPLTFMPQEDKMRLRGVSLEMVELASERTYMDGGESLRRLARHGCDLAAQLSEIAASFQKGQS
jgi:ATP-dependent DNA helicase RecG